MDSTPLATKHCNGCDRDLPLDAFYGRSDRPGQRLAICKACRSVRDRARYLAHKPPPRPRVPILPEKPCTKCSRTLPLEDFAVKSRNRDGRTADCAECRNAEKRRYNEAHSAERATYNQRYYRENAEAVGARIRASVAKNPDKYRAIHSNWKRKNVGACRAMAHRRYARQKSAGSWTQDDWERLKAQFEWRCLMCGRQEMTEGITLCFDHVIPLSLGGWNIISNAQPLCKSCNSKKHRKVLDLRKQSQRS